MICKSCSSDSLKEVRMSRYEATYQKTAMWVIVAVSIPLLFAFGIGFAILVPMVVFSFYFKYKHYLCDRCGALYQPYIGGLKQIGYHVNGKTYKENPAATQQDEEMHEARIAKTTFSSVGNAVTSHKCRNCGESLSGGAKFCSGCGTKVDS